MKKYFVFFFQRSQASLPCLCVSDWLTAPERTTSLSESSRHVSECLNFIDFRISPKKVSFHFFTNIKILRAVGEAEKQTGSAEKICTLPLTQVQTPAGSGSSLHVVYSVQHQCGDLFKTSLRALVRKHLQRIQLDSAPLWRISAGSWWRRPAKTEVRLETLEQIRRPDSVHLMTKKTAQYGWLKVQSSARENKHEGGGPQEASRVVREDPISAALQAAWR